MLGLRAAVELPFVETSGAVPLGENMLFSGTDPESYHRVYCNIKSHPLGPLGFDFTQHRQTLRPSVDEIRSKALRPFGLQ